MRKFPELRGEMARQDYYAEDIANYIGRKNMYVSNRMTGKKDINGRPFTFTTDEAYKILDFLGLEHSEITKYFPPSKESEKKRRTA